MLAGLSAGAMCWFEGGITRSSGPPETIAGLGLLPGSLSVHADGEPERLPVFLDAVRTGALPGGWAADDGVGLLFDGTRVRARGRPRARARARCAWTRSTASSCARGSSRSCSVPAPPACRCPATPSTSCARCDARPCASGVNGSGGRGVHASSRDRPPVSAFRHGTANVHRRGRWSV